MFAMRFKRDVTQSDHLVIAFNFLERALQEIDGIIFVSTEPVFVGLRDAFSAYRVSPRGADLLLPITTMSLRLLPPSCGWGGVDAWVSCHQSL